MDRYRTPNRSYQECLYRRCRVRYEQVRQFVLWSWERQTLTSIRDQCFLPIYDRRGCRSMKWKYCCVAKDSSRTTRQGAIGIGEIGAFVIAFGDRHWMNLRTFEGSKRRLVELPWLGFDEFLRGRGDTIKWMCLGHKVSCNVYIPLPGCHCGINCVTQPIIDNNPARDR